jgi:hypothetical protein
MRRCAVSRATHESIASRPDRSVGFADPFKASILLEFCFRHFAALPPANSKTAATSELCEEGRRLQL